MLGVPDLVLDDDLAQIQEEHLLSLLDDRLGFLLDGVRAQVDVLEHEVDRGHHIGELIGLLLVDQVNQFGEVARLNL